MSLAFAVVTRPSRLYLIPLSQTLRKKLYVVDRTSPGPNMYL